MRSGIRTLIRIDGITGSELPSRANRSSASRCIRQLPEKSSIPWDSPSVTEVLIRHQGGPWDWGRELRQRMEAHPKTRIIEFPDRVDFAPSFNRTLDCVNTPWVLLLPDDDHLLRSSAAAAFEAVAAEPNAQNCGFAAFGWYYFKDGRYLASHIKRRDLRAVLHYTPKWCSTLLNLRRVRELGGFSNKVGGFDDTVLLGRLAYEFDALVAPTPIGVYRLHAGQESAQPHLVWVPYRNALREAIGGYARSTAERDAFERQLANYGTPNRALEFIQDISFRLRSRTRPVDERREITMRKWSAG